MLEQKLEIDATRAKRPTKLPVVLTVEKVRRVLPEIPLRPFRLMERLIYGAGLRLMEACRLRVQDVDFDRLQLMVQERKGGRRIRPTYQGDWWKSCVDSWKQ